MNKISYALGLGIGQQLKSMGIEDFSVEDFTKSICDVLTDSEPAISHREAQALLNEYFDKQTVSDAQKKKAILAKTGKRHVLAPDAGRSSLAMSGTKMPQNVCADAGGSST